MQINFIFQATLFETPDIYILHIAILCGSVTDRGANSQTQAKLKPTQNP